MTAGKIKITVDNLDDAQGVVIDEENTSSELVQEGKEPTKKTIKKKTTAKVGGEISSKSKRKGRPAKKKEENIQVEEALKDDTDIVGDFMSKINISASEKKEVMDEIEKKSSKSEKTTQTEEKDELKFSSLAKEEFSEEADSNTEVQTEEESYGGEGQVKRSVGLYRKIAIFFLIATVVLLSFIFYFLFASVTITIIPDQERINNNMIIDVYDKDNDGSIAGDKIVGIVKKTSMDLTASYEASGEDVIGEEVAGEVTIYNYYTKNQPLVATTRLLSPDGKVYRIEETVNIPAGGEVKVKVYADEPSINMETGPTKFTIPGLWAGIQDKIYGESKSKIEYSQKVDKFVTQADIDNAIRDLKQQLVQKAKAEINKKYEDYSQVIYSIDDNSVFTEIEAERGDEVDGFDATITANIVAVAFDDQAAANLAEKKFISTLAAEKELIEFNRNNIIYTLDTFDYKEGTASINATFEGKVSLDSNSEVINKEEILELNKDQLDAYLMSKEGISGFDIEFFPSFIKRVPAIPDKIIIKTKR
ncbi:MAG: hypothetical protein PF572_05540 [Patescibacteria group bacterium]|jgi:hypothetical protein|nr:hypothetical protein [Patescibacteria group bacterium]